MYQIPRSICFPRPCCLRNSPCQGSWNPAVGAGPSALTGGTSAAHRRGSPSLRHFQSGSPPGKSKGRIMLVAQYVHSGLREGRLPPTRTALQLLLAEGVRMEGSQGPGCPIPDLRRVPQGGPRSTSACLSVAWLSLVPRWVTGAHTCSMTGAHTRVHR